MKVCEGMMSWVLPILLVQSTAKLLTKAPRSRQQQRNQWEQLQTTKQASRAEQSRAAADASTTGLSSAWHMVVQSLAPTSTHMNSCWVLNQRLSRHYVLDWHSSTLNIHHWGCCRANSRPACKGKGRMQHTAAAAFGLTANRRGGVDARGVCRVGLEARHALGASFLLLQACGVLIISARNGPDAR
jgi:hypothetical protein